MSTAEKGKSNVPCTHYKIPKPGEIGYNAAFDFPCCHNNICHICGPNLLYCQYQIQTTCGICGNDICVVHLGVEEDGFPVCTKCNANAQKKK